jgi:hypothetical protein
MLETLFLPSFFSKNICSAEKMLLSTVPISRTNAYVQRGLMVYF